MSTLVSTRRVLTGPRWSSAVVCERTAVYQATGAPESEPSEQVMRWRRRGIAIGEYAQAAMVADLRAQNRRPVVEVEVSWPTQDPVGTLHADLYIPHERHMVEVKSRVGCELDTAAVLQVSGQVVFHERAKRATVLVIDPQSGEERAYPVNAEAYREEVVARADAVWRGIRKGELPERRCAYPGDSPGLFCPFVEHCFNGWERPRPEDLPGWEHDLRRLADLEDQIAGMKQADALKAERERVRASLRAAMEPGTDYMAGGIRVRFTEVAGRETFSLSAVRKAGHTLPDELAPFVSTSEPHERWTIRRAEA